MGLTVGEADEVVRHCDKTHTVAWHCQAARES
jgi:hypothetical protein